MCYNEVEVMSLETIKVKTLLQRVNNNDDFWFHHDYNMNLYQGCSFGCIYCDSRSDCYQIKDFSQIKPKEDALAILTRELSSKRIKGIIGLGSMSDPYNPLEKELKLTRQALELIDHYGFSVSIVTKSALVIRDIDILKRIAKNRPVHVALTITESNDDIQKSIEPFSSPSSERFQAIQALSEAGIFAGILMMPVLPWISDREENIQTMIQLATKHHAKYLYPSFGLTMRNGQREYFYQRLDALFPGLKEKYMNQYHGNYVCKSPKSNELWKLFSSEITSTKLLYTMKDINKELLLPFQSTQMQLPL